MFENTRTPTLGIRISTILHALGIHPGEGLATGLLFGQFICLGVTLFTFYTASTALFLSYFDAAAIPYVFVLSALLLILSGLVFNRLERSLPFDRLLLGVLGALTLLLLLLRVGLWLGSASVMAFLIMVAFRISWTLANLVTWTLAGRLFNLRQSKRLFPLIMAGSVVGIIVTGLVNQWLINRLGTPNLLFVAMGGMVGAMILLFITLRRFRPTLAQDNSDHIAVQPESSAQSWTERLAIYRNRYILWIFGFSVISTVVTYLLEFIFVSAANVHYQTAAAYATFFGTYLTIATLGLLVLSLVGGTLLSHFGLKFGLLANSVVVASLALILLASQFVIGTESKSVNMLFWLVVLTKLSDDLLAIAINSASIRILLQPIAAAQRVSVQTVLESIAVPFSIGIVGLLLILVQFAGYNITPRQSIVLLVALSLVWLYASIKVYHAYRLALPNALQKRRIDAADTEFTVAEQEQVLHEGLQSKHPSVVLYSLNILAAVDPNGLVALLPLLLTHPADEVRLDVVQRLEQIGRTTDTLSVLPRLQQRLADEPSAQVRGALCQTLIALGDERMSAESSSYLTHPVRELRAATLTGLLRYGGIQGIMVAGPQLLGLIHSSLEDDRVLGAQIIGQVADPKFFTPLMALLTDEKRSVRNAAIESSGLVRNGALWPLVVQGLAEPATRKSAVYALIKGGDEALPAMAEFFAQPKQSSDVQMALARATGQIGGTKAGALLWNWIDSGDITGDSTAGKNPLAHHRVANKEADVAIWHGLGRSGFTSNGAARQKIDMHIEQELAQASWLAAARQAVLDVDGEPLLVDALTSELAQSRATIFDMLTVIGDSPLITQVRYILEWRTASTHDHPSINNNDQRAYAQEVLDDLLPPAFKSLLLPFLTEDLRNDNLQAIQQQPPQPPQDYGQWLHTLSNASAAQLSPWTKACAMYAAGNDTQPHDRRIAIMLSTIEKVIHLKAVNIFSQIPDHILTNIATVLEPVEYLPGQPIFQKGDPGDAMYVIVAGSVQIADDGYELERLGESGVFGELALLDNEPRSASATATDETLLLRLPAEAFYELLEEHSEIARGILFVLSQRLRARTQDLSALRTSLA